MTSISSNVIAIVVTYQSGETVSACLSALKREVTATIVVDNASEDDSIASANDAGARVIANRKNEGYGRANNLGISAASGAQWCLIANPDVMIEPGCVRELLAAANRNPLATVIVPRLVEPDGRTFFRSKSILSSVTPSVPRREECPKRESTIAFASGACMLVHRERFLQIGGFDDRIFLFYEDDDLCLRVRRAGQTIVHAHDAVAHHRKGRSSSITRGSIFHHRFHQAWSRVYVSKKYDLPTGSMAVISKNALKALGALLLLDRDRLERYAGSVAGVWSASQKKMALWPPITDQPSARTSRVGDIVN